MNKSICFSVLLMLLFPIFLSAQSVTGKLVDENGDGLAEIPLQLYTSVNNYFTTSGSDGTFIFDNITGIKDEHLPTDYSISNNYPNPFNPKTRIIITLPKSEKVKVVVFNLLGEKVLEEIERDYSSGTHFIDLELNGSPNGLYFARITIGNKYTVTKKMMLIYGSQHLELSGQVSNKPYNKTNNNFHIELETRLDSLVAENIIIGRKVFTNLPSLTGSALNLSNLIIERYCPGIPTVTIAFRTYNTVQIGNQCWLRENLNAGTRIDGSNEMTDNGILEKYCFDNNSSNCNTYGGLYQWNEAMQYTTQEGAQGICPSGWHIPTLADFQILMTYANNEAAKLVDESQTATAYTPTNETGFFALFAGSRTYYYSYFHILGFDTYFWSSTEYDSANATGMHLHNDNTTVHFNNLTRDYGFSVRCLKN